MPAPAAIAACIRGHACSDRDAGRGIIIRQGADVRRPSRLCRATGCRRSPGPDFHVSIEDEADIGAEAVASDRGSDGLPAASVTVDAEGAFVRVSASRRGQERVLAAVLQIRNAVLRQKGLEDVQCMPWEMQKAVTALVKDRWWHDKPDINREAVMERCRTGDALKRTKDCDGRAPYRVHDVQKGQNTQHMQSRFAQSHGNLQKNHQHTKAQHNEHNSQQWRT